MKIILFFILLLCTIGLEAYVVPTQRDFKPASQVMLEKQDYTDLLAASATSLSTATAGNTSAAQVVLSSFSAQPDSARNIVIGVGGTAADVASCDISVAGTNILGRAITETFSTTLNTSGDITGAKAFKTVSSVTFPAACEDSPFGVTYNIGIGEKIGIKRCLNEAGAWAWSNVAGVYESTRATVVVDVDEVEKNTADFNGTMNGSSDFIGYFIQNFRCLH